MVKVSSSSASVTEASKKQREITTTREQAEFFQSKENPVHKYLDNMMLNMEIREQISQSLSKMGVSGYLNVRYNNLDEAVGASQAHLIGLVRYYEGDRQNGYEPNSKSYKDKYGNNTNGFGKLTTESMTRQEAYYSLCEDLESSAGEVKRLLNGKLGKGTYESIPSSIREALIDLCYCKGLGKISGNSDLMNAIGQKDYAGVISNLVYAKSGLAGAKNEEDAGLMRRSLSRSILAYRDIPTLAPEQQEKAKAAVEKIYQRTGKLYAAKNLPTTDLDKIYKHFPMEADKVKSLSAGHSKEEAVQGKNGENTAAQASSSAEKTENSTKVKKTGDNWFKRACRAISRFFQSKLSKQQKTENSDEEGGEVPKTAFQKMLEDKNTTITPTKGELSAITSSYEMQEHEYLYKIARRFNIPKDVIVGITNDDKNYKKIENENLVQAGQKVKIQKLGYKIKKGDTLFAISQKFGISVEALKDLNNIADVNEIKAGDMLEIPGFVYKVKAGDTLTSLAKMAGVNVEYLKKINGLKDNNVKVGQLLNIVYKNMSGMSGVEKVETTTETKIDTSTKKTQHVKIETVTVKKTADLSSRPLLQKIRKVNGVVQATRAEFAPTKSGKLSGMTIIVNAGHGYRSDETVDVGTEGKKGMDDEWLLNYDNAMALKNELCAQGAKVIFLQGHVNIVSKAIAKEKAADLFISVHVNQCDKPSAKDRPQIFYRSTSSKSQKLAERIEKIFDTKVPKDEKGQISAADAFYINGKQDYAQSMSANHMVTGAANRAGMTAVLWEYAFMSQPKGRDRLGDVETRKRYAKYVTQAVIDCKDNIRRKS